MSRKEADKKYDEKRAGRTRNWTFILYPESAPENWIEIISDEMSPFAVSPIHDLDINEGTGELKKAHYHVLVTYSSIKSFNQVKELTERLNASVPQTVKNAKGLIRYMAHLDNPEKIQYDKNKIIGYCGFDVSSLLISSTDKRDISKDIIKYIKQNGVVEYCDLIDYVIDNDIDDWYDYLNSNSFVAMNYIKSRRHKIQLEREELMKV